MPHTITATLNSTTKHVTVTMTGLPAGRLNVERQTAAGWDTIRGGTATTTAAQTLTLTVTEVPQNTDMTFRSTVTNPATGTVIEQVTATTITTKVDRGSDWLYSTGTPGGIPIRVVSVSELTYQTNTTIVDVLGRPDRVAVGDVAQWPDVTIVLATFDAAERNLLRQALATGLPVGFAPQNPTTVGVDEEVWYLAVTGIAERRPTKLAQQPERLWELRCSRVVAPVPAT